MLFKKAAPAVRRLGREALTLLGLIFFLASSSCSLGDAEEPGSELVAGAEAEASEVSTVDAAAGTSEGSATPGSATADGTSAGSSASSVGAADPSVSETYGHSVTEEAVTANDKVEDSDDSGESKPSDVDPPLRPQVFTINVGLATVITSADATVGLYVLYDNNFNVISNARVDVDADVVSGGCTLTPRLFLPTGAQPGATCVIQLSAPATDSFDATEVALTVNAVTGCRLTLTLDTNPPSSQQVAVDDTIEVEVRMTTTEVGEGGCQVSAEVEPSGGLSPVSGDDKYKVTAAACDTGDQTVSVTTRGASSGTAIFTVESADKATWTVACPDPAAKSGSDNEPVEPEPDGPDTLEERQEPDAPEPGVDDDGPDDTTTDSPDDSNDPGGQDSASPDDPTEP